MNPHLFRPAAVCLVLAFGVASCTGPTTRTTTNKAEFWHTITSPAGRFTVLMPAARRRGRSGPYPAPHAGCVGGT
jgi:hypothetical protein